MPTFVEQINLKEATGLSHKPEIRKGQSGPSLSQIIDTNPSITKNSNAIAKGSITPFGKSKDESYDDNIGRENSFDMHHNRSSDTVPHDPMGYDRSIEVPVKEFKMMPTNSSQSQVENSEDSGMRQLRQTPLKGLDFNGLKTSVFSTHHNPNDSLRQAQNLDAIATKESKQADGSQTKLEARRGAKDRKQTRYIEDSLMKYEKEVDLMHREEVLARNDEINRSTSRSSERNINQGTQGEAQRNSSSTY